MKRLVGIHGIARSGKDTVADHMVEHFSLAKYELARPLKQICKALGMTHQQLYGDLKDEVNPRFKMTNRKVMTSLAEDAIKPLLGDDVFVFPLQEMWESVNDPDHATKGIVVSDVRLPIEADFIRDNGGVIFHVFRKGWKGLSGADGMHHTEAGILVTPADSIIVNDGTVEDLKDSAEREFLKAFNMTEAAV